MHCVYFVYYKSMLLLVYQLVQMLIAGCISNFVCYNEKLASFA